MEQEFPGVSDGEQGQAGDSESQELISLEVDLDKTVQGRALKSSLQSQVDRLSNELSAERRQREQEAEQATILRAQAEAILSGAKERDPEEYNELVAKAKLAEKEAKLSTLENKIERIEQEESERLAHKQKQEGYRNWWVNTLQQAGLDPSDPELAIALGQTMTDGNALHIINAMNKKQTAQPNQRQMAEQPKISSPVLPPSGGGHRQPLNNEQKEKLHGELNELLLNPTTNAARIAQIKSQLGI